MGSSEERAKRIAEIALRAAAATSGPWSAKHYVYVEGYRGVVRIETDDAAEAEEHSIVCAEGHEKAFIPGPAGPDAAFIAACREDVPWLLHELAKTRDALAQLVAAVDWAVRDSDDISAVVELARGLT